MRVAGRYEIVRELGRGGMATVYLARQIELDRFVALKELEALRAAEADMAQRFLREARMAGALSHPNIVTVYDYFESAGTPCIAMEYVDGGSLRPHVTREVSLPQVGGVLEGILAGLAHAERHGIVHRDLKPENVLLTADGGIKIADFGIAKASDQVMTAASLTATGTTMGTPAYMAPEQAMGQAVSPRTDLYSVGVIAFELFAGRAPFADTETPMGILLRQVNDPVPSVRIIRPDVDPRIGDWIERMVAKEPGDRPQSATAAWQELDEHLDEVLGARWRRDAKLPLLAPPVPAETAAGVATPATRRVTPTMVWADDATLAPAAPLPLTEPDDAPARRGRRAWAVPVLLLLLVGVVAALAGTRAGDPPATGAPAASPVTRQPPAPSPSRTADAGQPVPTQPAPTSPAAATPPAAPAPAAPPPAPVAVAPVPATGENADDGGDDGSVGGGGTGENADDGGDGP